MISGWLYCDESANLWLKSSIHAPMKLTENDREDIFYSVFAEISNIRRSEFLKKLPDEIYYENLLLWSVS